MTKLEIIDKNFPQDEISTAEVARLLKLTKAELLAEIALRNKRGAAAHRAWGRRKCKCGKLNRECGDIFHQMENIEPYPTPLFSSMPKEKAKAAAHEWVKEGK